ncbi:hypothetical protein P691DRAFT_199504 [Macrolepiota fuliginosa MF-IS2]|uniref:Uncharacterized protein n=1 Tax=Macrolepiota fuliginosa MF-IS2 TaxID=1400762 RepID=A0A9P5XQC5_9AGAR|nr:hypothetical protein P691DRAFT_199504 [Macrolepiota fuliginosa MF-IS2]
MSRGGNVLSETLAEEHSEAQQIRAKLPSRSVPHQSSGSTSSQLRIGFTPQPIVSASSLSEKHMDSSTRVHRSIPSKSSDEWTLVSSPLIAPGHHKTSSSLSAPTTPSKKQAISQSVGTGNFTNPRIPTTPRTPVRPSAIPTRPRPSPIITGISAPSGGTTAVHPHHTPNLSTSSSHSSSSSKDLETPVTPSNRKDRLPKIFDSSQYGKVEEADEDFTIVLNEDEAVHWTKQTSDLRQPSPTRSNWPTTPSSHSYPSPQTKLRPQTKMTASPFRSSAQPPATPTQPDSHKGKQDQKTKGRFGLSPRSGKTKSPSKSAGDTIMFGIRGVL